jgi:dTMP kinase
MKTSDRPHAARRSLSGCLITLEGGEGGGKTTQAQLLYKWLQDAQVPVTALREPGATRLGEKLRELLLDFQMEELRPDTEVLLFAAARAQAFTDVVAPALARGDVVVCDRFVDSSIAYQGFGLGVDRCFIGAVNDRITDGVKPDLTILLDAPASFARARSCRASVSADRIERRSDAYHEAVRQGYRALAAEEPERFKVLDATRGLEEVRDEIRVAVAATLTRRGYLRRPGPGSVGR